MPEDLLHDMIRTFHVSFEANDHVKEDICYGSSIPLRKAMYAHPFVSHSLNHVIMPLIGQYLQLVANTMLTRLRCESLMP